MNIHFKNVIPNPLRNITHHEQSIWNNSFSLQKGQKVMLNATSGKGKTTFTHTLSGLRKDYSGKILFDEQDLQDFSAEDWAELRKNKLSFVFQDLQLFPNLTVQENLQIKNDLTKSFTEDELKQMLEKLEIEDKWSNQCGLLSMGQQQRVAIIRALSQPYEWLLMDEPFSHLDENNTQLALSLIHKRTAEQGAGFILTSLGDDHQFTFDKVLNL
ncbi:ATP-binding cassette domain-containing protein [Brumimicrobium aurantiacum]|uniref:ATP-binding cassette domain-containing protein n=1 Tax=Brumimicrobium aurantiacum TaxID=1737063 RepID=A0A3E1EUW9_9FLAO|nr:ATP-binding cassette domain-containing protein [Brumimicrobium aurantiacum]RFC53345.1 ATP-binding cassette domain-containing protein [Brumimicrobium aurantiacum]